MYIKIRNYYIVNLKIAECATERIETALEWAERPENISNPMFYDKKSFVYYTPETITARAELIEFVNTKLRRVFPDIECDELIYIVEKSTKVVNSTKYVYRIEFDESYYDIQPGGKMSFPLSTAIWGAQDYRYTGDVLNLPSALENRPNPKRYFTLHEVK